MDIFITGVHYGFLLALFKQRNHWPSRQGKLLSSHTGLCTSVCFTYWICTGKFEKLEKKKQTNFFWLLLNQIGIFADLMKWAATRQNQQNGMCTLRRLGSAWASAVWSESLLSAWRKLGPLATHWVALMPRLIWVFAGHTVILLVLSWGGSYFVLKAEQANMGCRLTKRILRQFKDLKEMSRNIWLGIHFFYV